MAIQQPDKLLNLFKDQPLAEHGSRWDGLWREEFTPWDRAGPSMALQDLLADRPDLVPPPPPPSAAARPKALVPGCGRGYDVLLLAAFGYDAYGVDYSAEATKEAALYQEKIRAENDERYRPRDGRAQGHVKWLTGDFFADDWIREAGADKFDLIFDYTFFCALPVSARPAWAGRLTQLLAPGGRVVCLQWPTEKPWSTGGPPWGGEARAPRGAPGPPGRGRRVRRRGPHRGRRGGCGGGGPIRRGAQAPGADRAAADAPGRRAGGRDRPGPDSRV
ncbi:hypothetical protein GGTG_06847 [Gaeumannomyces tritici R3-111a-1]|uniref:Thiol methyltransferase 2 n=1 Tax=Gaeumannomyces tritici (strain R3-111a-1) TaxID=644352 RepID=J3P000_GAET3|nr:hypothetical protein GGTG_06847 [Gaeumannomyces tritici R3-111a-1]EJT76933.1 hypothetical protein GGTG_06847 [Gaeumannomyces tritici R3-111a-1]